MSDTIIPLYKTYNLFQIEDDSLVGVLVSTDEEIASNTPAHCYAVEGNASLPSVPSPAPPPTVYLTSYFGDDIDIPLIRSKINKWNDMKAMRANIQQNSNITISNDVFQCDIYSQDKIRDAVRLAVKNTFSNPHFTITWTLLNNTKTVLSISKIRQLGAAIDDQSIQVHLYSQIKRDEIAACTTEEEVGLVVWDYPVPIREWE